MGEHYRRYEALARYLNTQGWGILSFDHRGHGRSEGQRGHSPSYEDLMRDLDQALHQTLTLAGGDEKLPLVLMGHSMGGNLVLNYGLRRPHHTLAGVIASAPWLRLVKPPSVLLMGALRLLKPLVPTLSQPTKLEVSALSRDAAVVADYQADTLNHDRITAGFFFEVNQAGNWALSQAEHWKTPLLLYHGTGDRITAAAGTAAFADKVKPALLTYRAWEGWYHELHNEPQKEELWQWLVRWLEGVRKPTPAE
jgi:alpha-beta hydrolase superfamily lysophospholipase